MQEQPTRSHHPTTPKTTNAIASQQSAIPNDGHNTVVTLPGALHLTTEVEVLRHKFKSVIDRAPAGNKLVPDYIEYQEQCLKSFASYLGMHEQVMICVMGEEFKNGINRRSCLCIFKKTTAVRQYDQRIRRIKMDEKITEIEELRKWKKELEDLEVEAFLSPPISQDYLKKRWETIVNGTYLQKRLETVQKSKEKTLLKLAKLEEIEAALKAEIAKEE